MARKRISVTENGPYLVSGGIGMTRLEISTNDAGESVAYGEIERLDPPERYQLCRCGHSADKPYCDGSHVEIGFDGTETAGHGTFLEESVSIDGPGIRIQDARRLCAEARFCDRGGGLWNLVEKCDDPEIRALVEEEAELCPSGRYVACVEGTDEPIEYDYQPSIALIEDPAMGVSGPLFVRGGILVEDAMDVAYEVRNRVTLCRCGHSKNKPFCDGSHIKADFHDAT
jgi:CDGSH-type Zn-finger protein